MSKLPKNDIVLRLRQIFCCKGAEFTRPELQAAWVEIEELRQEVSSLKKKLHKVKADTQPTSRRI
jgi:iron-sulfur cluster repair protein YtfE (RIC family)